MASITAWAKKVWKDRKTEYPTRRTLTKTNGSQEIVTVTRNEGSVSQEGDAFSAENMNDLEERIDAGFTELTSKLGKKDFSNAAINLLSYSKNNKYIASDDGYVYFLAARNYSGYVYVNEDTLAIGGDGDLAISSFIKKGMSLYFLRTDKKSGDYVGYAYFFPLI